ncbi:hypothetical protein VARIO8X_60596 [Burkholderiales bacterium 8X]|nr:hypothetical protein VARIO8X_60596 [Burkholderiales bacterium 8X]
MWRLSIPKRCSTSTKPPSAHDRAFRATVGRPRSPGRAAFGRPAPRRRARGARTRLGAAEGLAQAGGGQQHRDRRLLCRHRHDLLRAGRRAGIDDAHPAGGAGQRPDRCRNLQPALHDARHRDDVPVRGADRRGGRGVPAARHAGRPRPAVSAALGLRLLGLCDRRPGLLLHALLRPIAGRRLVHVSAAHQQGVLARPRRGLVAAGHRLHRDLGDCRRHRTHHRHPLHPGAGHDAHEDAGVRLGDAGDGADDRLRVSGGDRRHHAARTRTRLRLALLHTGAGRRPVAVAAPLLVLRPSGGLHHLPAGRRHGLDDGPDPRRHAARRVPRHRVCADRGRRDQLRALGAPHVHRGARRPFARDRLGGQFPGGDTERNPGVLVDRHLLARQGAARYADALPAGLPLHLRAGRTHRRDGGGAALRLAGARQLLHRGALPLRADRRHGVPGVRRALLLGADLQRPSLVRRLGQVGLRLDVRRLQPELLPDAHHRPARHAAAGLHLPGRPGLERAQPAVDHRRLRLRARRAAVLRRCDPGDAPAREGPWQPLERQHARMAADARVRRLQHSGDPFARSALGPARTAARGRGRPPLAARHGLRRTRDPGHQRARCQAAAPAPAADRRLVALRRGGRHRRLLPAADGRAIPAGHPLRAVRDRGHLRLAVGQRPAFADADLRGGDRRPPAGRRHRRALAFMVGDHRAGGGRHDDLRVLRVRARPRLDGGGRVPTTRRSAALDRVAAGLVVAVAARRGLDAGGNPHPSQRRASSTTLLARGGAARDAGDRRRVRIGPGRPCRRRARPGRPGLERDRRHAAFLPGLPPGGAVADGWLPARPLVGGQAALGRSRDARQHGADVALRHGAGTDRPAAGAGHAPLARLTG